MPISDETIDNPRALRIRRAADLTDVRERRRYGRMLVEGPQAVREAVAFVPSALHDVFVEVTNAPDPMAAGEDGHAHPHAWASPRLAGVAEAADAAGAYVHPVTSRVMHRLAPEAQGVVAVADLPSPAMPTDDRGGCPGMVAAFWQIRDPGNAGAVIRVADAAGCAAAVFVDDCVDAYGPKVARSTAGSLFHLPVVHLSTSDFLGWSAGSGLPLIAADVHGMPDVRPVPLPALLARRSVASRGGRVCVLFGNEARGLPDSLLVRADEVASIPMYGHAESLNLATSAAVLLYALAMSGRQGTSAGDVDAGAGTGRGSAAAAVGGSAGTTGVVE
ncbi:RNA methyltransferase [uncultured Bifidobacterium sp.]|uniref:TrmH family RNA methyltransferase n=1 Tax=uncultured Bifidobacterium sp. TaxID=165187 RepID=UPI0028DCA8A3|nr:RNA methyltransferase [uncultured Bifidobacterium sp.]